MGILDIRRASKYYEHTMYNLCQAMGPVSIDTVCDTLLVETNLFFMEMVQSCIQLSWGLPRYKTNMGATCIHT